MTRDQKTGPTAALEDLIVLLSSPMLLALIAALVAACTSDVLPTDLGDCPEDGSLTWAAAGPVLAEHCADCHSSELLTPEDRQDATEGVDFDSAEGARAQDWLAWSQIRTGRMPKDGELSTEDALLLWEWWSCGGPE